MAVKRPPKNATNPTTHVPWTFLTNHAHVLICIAEDPNARIRDLADRVGITERAIQKIITELEEGSYLTHVRDGRRNVYRVKRSQPLRHPVEKHRSVAILLDLVGAAPKR
jgi:Mn-dependent DtxR family transcriptional regulator